VVRYCGVSKMNAQEQLKSICDDIYAITGIKTVIYDAAMRSVYAHPLAMGEFCGEVRRDPAMLKRCLACDEAGFAQCRRTGEICVYHCHMGLTEAAAPIVDRGTVIGYFLFGQLLEESCRDRVRERVEAGGFQNRQKLLDLLAAMEPTQESVIQASARLMSMCASYVQLQHVVGVRHKELAVAIAEYIQRRYADEITIEQLCRYFGISRGTLYTISKNTFGMGITDYIRTCRNDAAVELLRSSEKPVYQIAEEVGINDANYLTKLVKKHTGKTPRELRIEWDMPPEVGVK